LGTPAPQGLGEGGILLKRRPPGGYPHPEQVGGDVVGEWWTPPVFRMVSGTTPHHSSPMLLESLHHSGLFSVATAVVSRHLGGISGARRVDHVGCDDGRSCDDGHAGSTPLAPATPTAMSGNGQRTDGEQLPKFQRLSVRVVEIRCDCGNIKRLDSLRAKSATMCECGTRLEVRP
jgi:hypothetical protein